MTFLTAIIVGGGIGALIMYLITGSSVGAVVGYFIGFIIYIFIVYLIEDKKDKKYLKSHREEIYNKRNKMEDKVKKLEEEYTQLVEQHKEEEEKYRPTYTYEKNENPYGKSVRKKVCKYKDKLIFYTETTVTKYRSGFTSEHGVSIIEIKSVNKPGSIVIDREIPINDIIYFEEKGSISYTSHTYGGGSSATGAMIGGVLAGDAGAVVGSRKSIQTSTIEHDTRETILKLKNGIEKYPYKFYDFFCKLIPFKEFKTIQAQNLLANNTDKKSNLEDLKNLKELLDLGAITQEEFDLKKTELLNL